ncbi:E3 ubiquitin-protein ligase Topors [Chanos chanos]|uniref:E3 ubiquitin-protein ligase Topors n=1 Tax=Chanos chanos TaxID=29144 RepID=A0A6J2VG43_CHACN|nr:E3 ubiquitin-protein ligase Topors-like [Chanos chanos]
MMAPTKMKLRVRKREGQASNKSSQPLLSDASPDSKCPICLDRFNNVASLDRCLHRFCFRCIHEWSKNKAECPLCKQPFHSIFHSVKAENDFKEFVLRPMENGAVPPADANVNPTNRILRPRGQRDVASRRSQRQRPVPPTTPPDNGVMFESLSESATLAQDRGIHRMMQRLAARRRAQGEGRGLRERDVVAFRRALYRAGVRVRSVRDAGRHRDISATFLRQNPACLQRLLPWLRRELTVLYGSHGSLVNVVQHVVMSRVTHYNMEESAIRDELRPFLLARTDHFLHELISFARSSLSMEAYDRNAVYDCPAPSYEEGSSSDSSVIAISEDDADGDEEEEVRGESLAEHQQAVSVATSTESTLSQTAWDDETPGPSYSTAEHSVSPSTSQSQAERPETSTTIASYDGPAQTDPPAGPSAAARSAEEEEDECMIVGYVKPMAERTPELVQLSSDSTEEEEEKVDVEKVTPAAETLTSGLEPQHLSLNLPSLPSTLIPSVSTLRSPETQRNKVTADHTYTHHTYTREQEAVRHSQSRSNAVRRRRKRSRERTRSQSSSQEHSSREQPLPGDLSRGRDRSHRHSRTREQSSQERSRRRSRARDSLNHKRKHRHSGSSDRLSRECSNITSESRSREPSLKSWSGRRVSSSSSDLEAPKSLDRGRPHSKDRILSWKSDRDWEHSHGHSRSQSSLYWYSHGQERERERRRERGRVRKSRSRSSRSDSFHSSDPSRRSRSESDSSWRESHKSRCRRSRSQSSTDSRYERSRHDKPGGKRKYKTRHLERAAQERSTREKEEGSSWARRGSRSPSVEIIFERRAPDTHSRTHTHSRQKKKRRHKRKRREQRSPTVITIDSDSDRTIDCMDRVLDLTEQTVSRVNEQEVDLSDHELNVSEPEMNVSEPEMNVSDHELKACEGDINVSDPDINSSNHCAVPATENVFGSSSPGRPSNPSPESLDHTLNLNKCTVDVVRPSPSKTLDHPVGMADSLTDKKDSVTTTGPDHKAPLTTGQPSDMTLLESILQELEDFLPEEGGANSDRASPEIRADHEERTVTPHSSYTEAERETGSAVDQTDNQLEGQGTLEVNTACYN